MKINKNNKIVPSLIYQKKTHTKKNNEKKWSLISSGIFLLFVVISMSHLHYSINKYLY